MAEKAASVKPSPLTLSQREREKSKDNTSSMKRSASTALNAEVFVAAPHAVARCFDLFGKRRSPNISGLG